MREDRFIEGEWRGRARADWCRYFPGRLLQEVLDDERAEVVRDRAGRRITRHHTPRGVVYVKHMLNHYESSERRTTPVSALKSRMRPPRSLTMMRTTALMHTSGLHTPPIMLAAWRRTGWTIDNVVVTEEVRGDRVDRAIRDAPDDAARQRIIGTVAAEIARLHRAGFLHGDLLLGNMMRTETGSIVFLDNDRTRCWFIPLPRGARRVNLAQLAYRMRQWFGWGAVRRLLASYYAEADIPASIRHRLTLQIARAVRQREADSHRPFHEVRAMVTAPGW